MPHPEDIRFLQHAQNKGLLAPAAAEHCLRSLEEGDRAGRPVRVAQVIIRDRLMASDHVVAILKQIRDVSTGQQNLIGSDTWSELTAVTRAASPVDVGHVVAGFELKREIARGGMGILYEAWAGGERVAIKVLSVQAASSEPVVRRFQEEARLAASLQHPNLIRLRACGQLPPSLHFIVFDFFDGKSLADLIRPGRLTPRKCLEVVATVADACSAMHARGVTHRDIKPSNILVGKASAVVLADFGLAKDAARYDAQLTQLGFGKLLGTPAYMSPEQADGELARVGPASDVYALGSVIFRALTGRYPFAFDSYMKTIQAIARGPAPRLRGLRPDAPEALDQLVARVMAQSPERRPSSLEVSAELRRLLASEPLIMPPAPPSAAV
ncbi:MAG: serine/threonine-protein kinase [Planctomycetota bacterium]